MIKVLYICGTAHIGGAEVSLLNLIKRINREYFLPQVVLPQRGLLFDKIAQQGVEVNVTPLMEFSRKKWLPFLFSTLKLAFLIRKEKIDLVHANSIYIAEQSFFAAKLAGIPCLCHVRDLAPVLGAGKLRSFAFRKMQRLIAISEAVKKDLVEKLHIPEDKITRIYNGVDTDQFSPDICGDKFRDEFKLGAEKLVGMIARFSPEKGQETFLKAAAEVLKTYKEVGFVIAGDAKLGSQNYKEEMIVLSNKLGLQGKVVFTGFRDDLPQVLAALDILVVPSRAEPFGRVIIEAFACGTPVIASNSGATNELISDKCGILFALDSIGELTRSIICLLEDEVLAERLATTARKIVKERFDIQQHVLELERLYRDIAG